MRSSASAAERVPGPRGALLFRTLLALRRDPLAELCAAARGYGDLTRFAFGRRAFYLVAHPRDIARVLQDNHRNYTKRTRTYDKIRTLLGDGLVTSDGEQWQRQRALVQPAFHHQQIAEFADVVRTATGEMLRRWDTKTARDEGLDIGAEMKRLTLVIVCRALFGTDIGHEGARAGVAISRTLDYTARRAEGWLDTGWFPTPARGRFRRSLAQLDDLVFRLVARRRLEPVGRQDLLTLLLEAHGGADGGGLTDRELRDQVLTLLFAGHETTATALTWAFQLVAAYPEVQSRLRADIAAAGTDADLGLVTYARQVLWEVMRLLPPFWLIERRAQSADELAGFSIPAGATVALSQYVTHRHPAFWRNPDRFDPDRFGPERSAGRPRYAYFPFGGGPRACMGAAFALMEAQLILTLVLARSRVVLVSTPQPAPVAGITLRPRAPVLVRVYRARD